MQAIDREIREFGEAWERAAAERQREQEAAEAAERARRAWVIENDPHFAKISVLQRRGIVARWDEQFPPPKNWIKSPAARENRIAELARKMKLAAFDTRTWDSRNLSGRRWWGLSGRPHGSGSSRSVPAIPGQGGTPGRRADIRAA